jgi:hypothetical protein
MQTLQAGRPLHIKVVTLLVEWTAGKCGSMSHILGPMHTATFLYFSLLPGARRIQIENGRQVKLVKNECSPLSNVFWRVTKLCCLY